MNDFVKRFIDEHSSEELIKLLQSDAQYTALNLVQAAGVLDRPYYGYDPKPRNPTELIDEVAKELHFIDSTRSDECLVALGVATWGEGHRLLLTEKGKNHLFAVFLGGPLVDRVVVE